MKDIGQIFAVILIYAGGTAIGVWLFGNNIFGFALGALLGVIGFFAMVKADGK